MGSFHQRVAWSNIGIETRSEYCPDPGKLRDANHRAPEVARAAPVQPVWTLGLQKTIQRQKSLVRGQKHLPCREADKPNVFDRCAIFKLWDALEAHGHGAARSRKGTGQQPLLPFRTADSERITRCVCVDTIVKVKEEYLHSLNERAPSTRRGIQMDSRDRDQFHLRQDLFCEAYEDKHNQKNQGSLLPTLIRYRQPDTTLPQAERQAEP